MSSYPVLQDTDPLSSPGLWVNPDAVSRNISQMITDIGGDDHVGRLRPHLKTHKMVEVARLQTAAGISKCKVATPMEAEVAALGGLTDVLIAHQLVGPKIDQFNRLVEKFPQVKFSTVIDDPGPLKSLGAKLTGSAKPVSLWIDVDCGMHRSGIAFGSKLDELRAEIEKMGGIDFGGLHVYDGHLHDPSLDNRRRQALEVIDSVHCYLSNHDHAAVVGGGSPTFGIWASETEWECSPGTTLFWDYGYGENYPDLEYQVAAGLITRVISKPGPDCLCLDLGHKAIAAEMPLEKRVFFPEISEYELVGQSEEHLVLRVPDPSSFSVGDAFTAIPRHICPTVALHSYASVVKEGVPTGDRWQVAGRDRF